MLLSGSDKLVFLLILFFVVLFYFHFFTWSYGQFCRMASSPEFKGMQSEVLWLFSPLSQNIKMIDKDPFRNQNDASYIRFIIVF